MRPFAPSLWGVSAVAPPRSCRDCEEDVLSVRLFRKWAAHYDHCLPRCTIYVEVVIVSPAKFDPGVIVRALRFRAKLDGFRLERGHYMDRSDDRADRWYAVPLEDE